MASIQLTGYPTPVPVDSILWLEGEANYTRVHFVNSPAVIVTQPLQWFEQFPELVRVHRSAIVNPAYIREFVQKRGRSGLIRLVDDREIPIARTRLDLIAARLMPVLLPRNYPTD
ncbi:LytTR family DNA-binding domain-containing protein [Spirosoma pomorum]